jgi:hypothetical protein
MDQINYRTLYIIQSLPGVFLHCHSACVFLWTISFQEYMQAFFYLDIEFKPAYFTLTYGKIQVGSNETSFSQHLQGSKVIAQSSNAASYVDTRPPSSHIQKIFKQVNMQNYSELFQYEQCMLYYFLPSTLTILCSILLSIQKVGSSNDLQTFRITVILSFKISANRRSNKKRLTNQKKFASTTGFEPVRAEPM